MLLATVGSPRNLRRGEALLHPRSRGGGAGAGEAYAKRGFRLADGQRCGDHDVRGYLDRLEAMKRTFARLAAGG